MGIAEEKLETLRKKVVGVGEVVLSINEHPCDVRSPLLYLLEDEVYIYAHCLDFGIFAYARNIHTANEYLAEAISVNITELHKEACIEKINDTPSEEEYLQVYQESKRTYDKDNIKKISERILAPENTEVSMVLEKEPLTYKMEKIVKIIISHIDLKKAS